MFSVVGKKKEGTYNIFMRQVISFEQKENPTTSFSLDVSSDNNRVGNYHVLLTGTPVCSRILVSMQLF